STWENIKNFEGGTAIFTQPNTPIKCAGAPQKIMWLAEEHFRDRGLRDKCQVKFVSGGAAIFGVQKYREALEPLVRDRNIDAHYKHNLVAIRGNDKIAIFENLDTKERVEMKYDMIHVTPPMGPMDFIKKSPLADEAGWVDVDKYTLQHKKFENIFSIGDGSSLPTSRTGAAVREQGPVLINNLMSHMYNQPLVKKYSGYASCPLITGRGKCILAEFDYDGKPMESFPFDQGKERWSMYMLKRHMIPFLYWNAMMKGYF
ncbi:MAG: NAD(P)/FAD-dependent oxidoreductase, partial [Bdellovibrionales bacterium]|nr:NAD(P)/FAD-dependent oxidoreductase [Bdellovibrionales bacterium]